MTMITAEVTAPETGIRWRLSRGDQAPGFVGGIVCVKLDKEESLNIRERTLDTCELDE